jgi:endonuclease YncB( thermonuclease family)
MSDSFASDLKQVFTRYKWLILGGCSFMIISLLVLLVVAVLLFETNPGPDQLVESPVPLSLTNTYTISITNTPTPEVQSTATPHPTGTSTEVSSREIAFVMQVIDGDTIEVILDGVPYNLRYIGIDAPEMGMPFSEQATEANQRLVEGQIVELERDVSETDQYGRLLRYVYLNDGLFVNAELVRLGFAAALTYPPDIKYQKLIDTKEQEAKEAGAGLWAPSTATPTFSSTGLISQLQVDPMCSQFNAPGNDNENKNEEYVCIANIGTGLVEMSGWSIHDEYGWTYQFPAFTLETGAKVRIMTGCGENTLKDLFWCKDETAVWNNDGDCVYLSDSTGELIADYCY